MRFAPKPQIQVVDLSNARRLIHSLLRSQPVIFTSSCPKLAKALKLISIVTYPDALVEVSIVLDDYLENLLLVFNHKTAAWAAQLLQ